MAARGYKVSIDGHGPDEMLGGYVSHFKSLINESYKNKESDFESLKSHRVSFSYLDNLDDKYFFYPDSFLFIIFLYIKKSSNFLKYLIYQKVFIIKFIIYLTKKNLKNL